LGHYGEADVTYATIARGFVSPDQLRKGATIRRSRAAGGRARAPRGPGRGCPVPAPAGAVRAPGRAATTAPAAPATGATAAAPAGRVRSCSCRTRQGGLQPSPGGAEHV